MILVDFLNLANLGFFLNLVYFLIWDKKDKTKSRALNIKGTHQIW